MKRILKAVRNFFKNLIWRIVDFGFIHLKIDDKSIKIFRFFGHSCYKSREKDKCKIDIERPTFYLKINKDCDYSIVCIQQWLDVIKKLNADYYFICDNKKLERRVLTQCTFRDGNIKFIKSKRHALKSTVNNLYTGGWKNATFAHITPFWHSKRLGKKNFWNIDADDTLLLMPADKLSKAIEKVESMAEEQDICAISLDMWRSKTHGKHWSLGVLLINDNVDFMKIFNSERSFKWADSYNHFDDTMNLDWYMTYLKDSCKYNIQSFYIENTVFIHWGSFIFYQRAAWVNYWQNGKIIYPLNQVFGMNNVGVIDIADCIKIDVGITLEESKQFFIDNVSEYSRLSQKQRKLHQ